MLIAGGALVSVAGASIVPTHSGDVHKGSLRPVITDDIFTGVRVSRTPFRAERLRLGMSKVDVERIMDSAAETEKVAGTGIEVSTYWAGREEPLSTRLTIRDGRLSAIVLDVGGRATRDRPAFTGAVLPGLSRAGVVHAIGRPEEDYQETIKGMTVEHMLFESPTHAPASVFLVSDRVVAVSTGRDAPPELASVTLPIAPRTPTVGQPIERIRVGMTPSTVAAIYGDATWSVHSSFKGLTMLVLAYANPNGDVFARFTFVGGALTEMSI